MLHLPKKATAFHDGTSETAPVKQNNIAAKKYAGQ
jgi:hypothetical protein